MGMDPSPPSSPRSQEETESEPELLEPELVIGDSKKIADLELKIDRLEAAVRAVIAAKKTKSKTKRRSRHPLDETLALPLPLPLHRRLAIWFTLGVFGRTRAWPTTNWDDADDSWAFACAATKGFYTWGWLGELAHLIGDHFRVPADSTFRLITGFVTYYDGVVYLTAQNLAADYVLKFAVVNTFGSEPYLATQIYAFRIATLLINLISTATALWILRLVDRDAIWRILPVLILVVVYWNTEAAYVDQFTRPGIVVACAHTAIGAGFVKEPRPRSGPAWRFAAFAAAAFWSFIYIVGVVYGAATAGAAPLNVWTLAVDAARNAGLKTPPNEFAFERVAREAQTPFQTTDDFMAAYRTHASAAR